MSKTLEAVLDRYEKMAIERADLTAERDMARAERDHARDLCGKRQIELASLETKNGELKTRLERSSADGDELRKQNAAYRQEAAQNEAKFKELYEAAAAVCSTTGGTGKVPRLNRLRAALKEAHDCLDWIPF